MFEEFGEVFTHIQTPQEWVNSIADQFEVYAINYALHLISQTDPNANRSDIIKYLEDIKDRNIINIFTKPNQTESHIYNKELPF